MTAGVNIISLLLMGLSATAWAVAGQSVVMPLVWLALLLFFILVMQPEDIPYFLRRLLKTATVLVGVSLLQVLFRRSGRPLVSVAGVELVFSDGFREAVLLWIRFMILFLLARVMACASIFQFLVLGDKMKIPLNFSLLLLLTVKLLPFIYAEGRRVLWFFRFRGISFRSLPLREKSVAVKQLASAVLLRSVEYVFHSALTLELRGYGQPRTGRIPARIPFRAADLGLILLTLILNVAGLLFR
ncbi:hypothetical protein JXO52_00810 [bacterium]|nr:hypothetical protein [bacterium]